MDQYKQKSLKLSYPGFYYEMFKLKIKLTDV